MEVWEKYSKFFRTSTRDCSEPARQYMCGLVQAQRKNMERMEEVVPDSDEQVLQHFLSNSPWDERAVLDQIALDTNELLGGSDNCCLLIDESGLEKKGCKSVGVSRQWNGRLGKVDNCQVGVFAALGTDDRAILIDTRLFLPEEWVKDKARCLAAKIPEDKIVFKKKCELALEMVDNARKLGLRHRWIGADGFYGQDPKFLRELADRGEIFMVDIHRDQHIYLEDPGPYLPRRRKKKGRKPKQLQSKVIPFRVDTWADSQGASSWQYMALRDSTKGEIRVEVLHRQVWLWDGQEEAARRWHLLVRRDKDTQSDYKYSLSNAPEDTPAVRLAYMQGQRYWIERAIEDGKSETGLADYQVRGWRGWHHHMALVMLSMLFMLQERINNKDEYPLLSCSDIETLLAHFLPRRDVNEEEVIRQLEVRHQKRQVSIDTAYRKQRIADALDPPKVKRYSL